METSIAVVICVVVVVVGVLICVAMTTGSVRESLSDTNSVDQRVKEREEKDRLDKEKREKEEAEKKAAEEKKEKEERKWESEGPDYESEYKVGDIVYHIGAKCMVVGARNRKSTYGMIHAGFGLWSIDCCIPPLYGYCRQDAFILIQFPDQMSHHRISEREVELKITK